MATLTATIDSPRVVALLERQLDLYQQLRLLSDQQRPLVEQGAAESLLAVLSQRQKLIQELAGLNEELDPYRQRWAEFWASLESGERQRVGGLVSRTQEILAAIMERDEADRRQLQEAKGRVAGEMGRINQAGAAIHAYRGTPGPNAPRFTNHQG